MGILTGLEMSAAVPKKHKRPVRAVGALLFSIIAGIHNLGVIHHRARAFRNGFEGFHKLDQHLRIVLPDLNPGRVSRLLHMTQTASGSSNAQSFPCPEILTASGVDSQDIGQVCLQFCDADLQQGSI